MIEGTEVNIDMNYADQSISCLECGKYWTDIYKLVDVEEIEE